MTVQGLDRLQRKLKRFPVAVEQEIRAAMETSANEIVALMKSLVPVDSGELRESIGWTFGDRPRYSQAIVTAKSPNGNLVLTIYAGNERVRYAHLVEFGSSPHINAGQFAGTQHPGTAATPFFFPSFRALRRRAKSRITRAVNKAAKKVAAGG